MVQPNFCWFSLFLISTHFENFNPFSSRFFKILEKDPFEVEIPHWNPFEVEVPHWNLFEVEVPHGGFPNFRPDLVLPDTYNGLKFEFLFV